MADVTQTLALVTLAQSFRGNVVRQINRRAAFARSIKKTMGEGKNTAWVPESSGALAETFSEGADAANFGSDAQASAILSWGQYRSNFHISGLAMAGAGSSESPLANRDLWMRNVENASGVLASTINADLYTGSSAIIGLDSAIGSVSNTYATIERTSATYWRPYVVDPGVATALSFAQIRTDLSTIYTNSGFQPDLAMVGPAVFATLGGLFDNTRRYVQEVRGPNGDITLDASYQALEVDGCLFVRDKDAPANSIYYLNSDYIELQVLAPKFPPAVQAMVQAVSAEDGFGAFPMGMNLERLAKNGDSERYMMKTYVQLVVRRPNAFGKRLNVA